MVRRTLLNVGVSVANLIVLLLPAWAVGPIALWGRPELWVFGLGVSLFCLGDLSATQWTVPLMADSASERRHRRLALVSGVLILMTLATCSTEFIIQSRATSSWSFGIGSFLITVGVALRYSAIRTLGSAFVTEITVFPGRALVRSGVYRWLRHPSETGLLLFTLGSCVVLASRAGLLVWCLGILPSVSARLRLEERELAAAFGSEFDAYCRRTTQLIPFVY
jgi:protein-S-isoprenylcysteine O-methyltransferase Ste14